MIRNNISVLTGALQLLVLVFFVNSSAFAEPNSTAVQATAVRIVDGKVIGEKVLRFTQGGRAEIHWMTDRPLDIHLHGYDIEQLIQPGSDITMVIDLYATGRFPVTVHAHSHSSGKEEQTLVYVEVYPND